jgi:hypothetical protein
MGSVAKNILTTFYSGNESGEVTISCVATEFLQQSPGAAYKIVEADESRLDIRRLWWKPGEQIQL